MSWPSRMTPDVLMVSPSLSRCIGRLTCRLLLQSAIVVTVLPLTLIPSRCHLQTKILLSWEIQLSWINSLSVGQVGPELDLPGLPRDLPLVDHPHPPAHLEGEDELALVTVDGEQRRLGVLVGAEGGQHREVGGEPAGKDLGRNSIHLKMSLKSSRKSS